MDEEEEATLQEAFDHDYDVAHSFRTDIVPRAVMWYIDEVKYYFFFVSLLWKKYLS